MNPTPSQIRQARIDASLSQRQAASLIGYSLRGYQGFEAAGKGNRKMRPMLWDTFQKLLQGRAK